MSESVSDNYGKGGLTIAASVLIAVILALP